MTEIIGLGLANIDLVAHVKDEFLTKHSVPKGLAKKFDDLSFGRLRGALPKFDAIAGGCAANTLCGLAAIGISSRFFGKIGNDSFESLYRASFKDYMVSYDVSPANAESSQCAVLITPDGERSFAYIHGASWSLAPEDIDPAILAQAGLIYTEIYLFEFGANRNVARSVFESAAAHKTSMVMKVMDGEYGRRYSQNLYALAQAKTLTLLIGNHDNMPAVTGTKTLDETIKAFQEWPCDVLITANKDGSYYIAQGQVQHFPVIPVESPRNTAGAGDQFVAGFLAGRIDGKPVAECMAFAAQSARMILMHDTARPPLISGHAIRF
jgi:sugar/nucleoside kinase (ribokinase family)